MKKKELFERFMEDNGNYTLTQFLFSKYRYFFDYIDKRLEQYVELADYFVLETDEYIELSFDDEGKGAKFVFWDNLATLAFEESFKGNDKFVILEFTKDVRGC